MTKKINATPDTHCQICGRPIQANTGKIAHHGYKRPGDGWQTASCYGARELPYEVSRDAIPRAIELANRYIAAKEKTVQALRTEPPATLTYQKYAGFGRTTPVQIEKPADFDPATARKDYRIGSYVSLWFDAIADANRFIDATRRDVETLQKRYDDWKAPVSA